MATTAVGCLAKVAYSEYKSFDNNDISALEAAKCR